MMSAEEAPKAASFGNKILERGSVNISQCHSGVTEKVSHTMEQLAKRCSIAAAPHTQLSL